MAVADNYPPMDPESCWFIGMNGGCGRDCILLRRGDCEVEDELLGDYAVKPRPELVQILFFELGERDV